MRGRKRVAARNKTEFEESTPPKRKKPREKAKTAAEEKTNGAQIQNMPPLGRRNIQRNLINMIIRKYLILLLILLILPIFLAVFATNLPLPFPPVPKILELFLIKIVMFILPGNAHGGEEAFDFLVYWLLSFIIVAICLSLFLCLTKAKKRRA